MAEQKRSGRSELISKVITLAAFVVITSGLIAGLQFEQQLLPTASVAPDFTYETFERGTHQLSQLKGRVVLLDFWATWCPPCREELPALLELAQEYESKGVTFVALNDDGDPTEARFVVPEFAKDYPTLLRHVAFSDDQTKRRYRVDSLPSTFVLDRQGRVVASGSGARSKEQLREWLEQALAASP